jgi:capsular polysaccharide export protein
MRAYTGVEKTPRPMRRAFLTPFSTAKKIRHLNAFLEMPLCDQVTQASHIVGWGYKTTGKRAMAMAARKQLRYLLVEDGFLALSPGMNTTTQRLSLVVDELAPYFDTSSPTQLEDLIRMDAAAPSRTPELLEAWRQLGTSKYAQPALSGGELPTEVLEARSAGRPIIVLLDQIAGDTSLSKAFAGERPFERMVQLARMTHPGALLVIKPHPREGERSGRFGKKQGCLTGKVAEGILRCHQRTDLRTLAEVAERVYCVTSHAGFECLLWGGAVTCVGHPWYAGWGLTTDCFAPERRVGLPTRSLEQLFWAAYGLYARYVHPATGRRMSLEQALAHLQLQYDTRRQTPNKIAVVDCQYWKRQLYRDFLPGAQVRYVDREDIGRSVTNDWTLVVWGQRIEQGVIDDWRQLGFRVLQVEDGFLRSVGLGCELVRPLSLCFDDKGLYADPRTDSQLLQAAAKPLTEDMAREVQRFLKLHHDLRLSKYLLRGQREAVSWQTAEALAAAQRPILLLCGQVSDDVSVRTSGCKFASFERLAQEIKRQWPHAYLVYRPHPDVVRGLRPGELHVASADLNDSLTPTRALVELADAVHVVNSLVGFEALLLSKTVHTWGRSWYAGWGLTQDHLQEPREVESGHAVTVQQLAHAAYLEHPRYFEPVARQFISPCAAAEVLALQREQVAPSKPGIVKQLTQWMPRSLVRWGSARVQDWLPNSQAG